MSDISTEPTRRRLTSRQAETVAKLTSAAMEEVRASGYAGLRIRNVAARAGVGAATAYMYFSSKEHLLAEVYWRTLQALPPVAPDDREPADRVVEVLREIVLIGVAQPDLAGAATVSLLDSNPDVHHLRARVGGTIRDRLVTALGPGHDHTVLIALEYAYSGAMLHAGMGFITYAEVADRLADTARLIMKGAS